MCFINDTYNTLQREVNIKYDYYTSVIKWVFFNIITKIENKIEFLK